MLVALAGLAPAFGWAALQWDNRQVQLAAKPGDKEAVVAFSFKNIGVNTVTITQIQSTCGCTTADLAKRTYAPGEAGEIKAVFTFGDRVGLQEKSIEVAIDDPSSPAVSLVLRITIPEMITCTPRLLLWTKGGAITEQSAIIAAVDFRSLASVEITGPTPTEITQRIEPVEPGKKYRLIVRPLDGTKTTNAALHGLARFDDGTAQSFTVYALVK
jgi:hypothetical protein